MTFVCFQICTKINLIQLVHTFIQCMMHTACLTPADAEPQTKIQNIFCITYSLFVGMEWEMSNEKVFMRKYFTFMKLWACKDVLNIAQLWCSAHIERGAKRTQNLKLTLWAPISIVSHSPTIHWVQCADPTWFGWPPTHPTKCLSDFTP